MRSLAITSSIQNQASLELLQIPFTQAAAFLLIVKPHSFEHIVSLGGGVNIAEINDKEFWKNLYLSLKENGTLSLSLSNQVDQATIQSLMKLNGFTQIQIEGNNIQASKPKWQQSGAPLKRNTAAQSTNDNASTSKGNNGSSNPWANLKVEENKKVELINEDELMNDESAADDKNFGKFSGTDDKVKPGKACANCSCGRKELEEGRITVKDLEKGNVQSDCGKCYLGDAFRCGSCPFLGTPAFEQGDKVKLKNADGTSQAKVESEEIKVKVAGSTNKVVLDL